MARLLSKMMVLLVVALFATLSGCSSRAGLDDAADYTVVIGDQSFFTEPVDFNNDIGIHARAVRNTLVISWRNNRAEEIMVRPEDLAIIDNSTPERAVYPFNIANINMARFQPLLLKPGQAGVMIVEMRLPIALSGQRLAYFNRRQDLMARTDVE